MTWIIEWLPVLLTVENISKETSVIHHAKYSFVRHDNSPPQHLTIIFLSNSWSFTINLCPPSAIRTQKLVKLLKVSSAALPTLYHMSVRISRHSFLIKCLRNYNWCAKADTAYPQYPNVMFVCMYLGRFCNVKTAFHNLLFVVIYLLVSPHRLLHSMYVLGVFETRFWLLPDHSPCSLDPFFSVFITST